VRTFGFVVHPDRSGAQEAAASLRGWLDHRGMTTRTASAEVESGPETVAFDEGLDVVVSVGGDGTFLRAAHVASRTGCPVLGVKVGRDGFLTEVEPTEAPGVLERVIEGTARIEERLALVAEPDPGAHVPPQWALNEMIVEKTARHRLIRLGLFVGETYVTTLSADGVIVATPTGSTAYSFSAGGPIVSPTMGGIVVTPVAAHMVFDRSLVLGVEEHVRLEVLGEEPGLLSADGRESLELPVGSSVRIARAPEPARLIRRDDAPPFIALVRDKFELPDEAGGAPPPVGSPA
jgi:NAD+ kinase